MEKNGTLPAWYDRMLGSPLRMTLFVLLVIAASQVLFLYGALLPLFRK